MSGIFKKIRSLFKNEEKHPVHEVLKRDLHEEALAIVKKRVDKEKARKEQLKLIRHKLENGIPLNNDECKRIRVLKKNDGTTSYR